LEVEPSDAVARELKKEKKKDKKPKKEKKEKKKKKELSASSANRKTKLVEPITQTPPADIDDQLFNGVSPNTMFGGLGDLGGDVDWEAEWNEEFSVKNAQE
jgi:hypothetical protein